MSVFVRFILTCFFPPSDLVFFVSTLPSGSDSHLSPNLLFSVEFSRLKRKNGLKQNLSLHNYTHRVYTDNCISQNPHQG